MNNLDLKNLITLAKTNVEDAKTFQLIISLVLENSSLNELELSEVLKTSRPTICRWKNGGTSPHSVIKLATYNTIMKIDFLKNS